MRSLLPLAITLSIFLAACAAHRTEAPAPNGADVRVERLDREFEIPAGVTRIAIDNPWGEINVRGRDEREVGVHAVIQRMPPAFRDATLRKRRDGDTLRIEVAFPDAPAPSKEYGRADVAVYVPADLALSLSTREDRIAATRRRGPIEARTDSGEIHASSLSRLDLRSRSGQIRAMEIGRRWQGESTIRTDSGRIVLLVPTFGDVALQARTSGRLTSGFGLSVHTLPDGGHEAHARYGAGTSVLRAESARGEIVLEQLVLLGDDKELPEDDD